MPRINKKQKRRNASKRRRNASKKRRSAPKTTYSIANQVTYEELDETFEKMCEAPQTAFDIHQQNKFNRKKEKYPNLFVGGGIEKPYRRSVLRSPIAYKFGPNKLKYKK